MPTIRPPVKWHGGKHYLAKRIIEHFPTHKVYVEPFGGAASVLLNKPPSEVEVYNDLDSRIVRLFSVIKTMPDEFRQEISLTPYSEEWFAICKEQPDTMPSVKLAARDYVIWRQSIGGRGDAFSYSKKRSRRGMADAVSGFLSSIDDNLPLVIERLRGVQIMNRDFRWIIEKFDSPDTLFYCDPPYVHSTRASENVYRCEMRMNDHVEMVGAMERCEGRIVLSGYPCELYDTLLEDWRTIEFDMPNHAAGGKSKARKTETLWMNWLGDESKNGTMQSL